MNVAGLCKRTVVTVRAGDELLGAARLMRDEHVGYLIVVEPNHIDGMMKPVGVLTDRDIVISVVAADADVRLLTVGDVMTQQPTVVGDLDAREKALREMRRIGVRRVPVVNTQGHLVGVLSLDDVLDAVADELQNVVGSIRNEQRVEAVLRT